MRGKRRLALIGLAAVLGMAALGFGINTALVAASDNTTDGDSTTAVVSESDETDSQTNPHDIFVSKLAEKLGLDEETVANAMEEAREEMRQEALEKRLQEAIDEGLITQEQANEILEWMNSRPEALDDLHGFGLGLEGGPRMRHHRHGGP